MEEPAQIKHDSGSVLRPAQNYLELIPGCDRVGRKNQLLAEVQLGDMLELAIALWPEKFDVAGAHNIGCYDGKASVLDDDRPSFAFIACTKTYIFRYLYDIVQMSRREWRLRIEKAFGVKMDTMMRMGAADEIARMGKREGLIRVPLAVGQTR
jgi:hypothetical protein